MKPALKARCLKYFGKRVQTTVVDADVRLRRRAQSRGDFTKQTQLARRRCREPRVPGLSQFILAIYKFNARFGGRKKRRTSHQNISLHSVNQFAVNNDFYLVVRL